MKRLEISRLMDEYTDTEFFPEGGSAADADAVKARVLAQAAQARKRRMPRWKTALIAAALAVGCVLSIAAGLPATVYHLVTGGTVTVQRGPDGYASYDFSNQFPTDPVVLEDGRLWLAIGDERTDITDLIDMETPYILEHTDPETGLSNYLVVGGTPEDFGYCSYQELPSSGYLSGGYAGGGAGGCYTPYCTIDGVPYDVRDLTPEQYEQRDPGGDYDEWRPWYLNAMEQLRERGINIR